MSRLESRADIDAVALQYLSAPHTPNHPSYKAFVSQTLQQWERLLLDGWKFERVDALTPSEGTYSHSSAMLVDIARKQLRVDTAGQQMAIGHPLSKEWLPRPWTINEIFRAVHDVYGHGAIAGGTVCDFETFEGESQAYLNHKLSYTPAAWPALYGETMGQLCHYFSGRGFVALQECKILPVLL